MKKKLFTLLTLLLCLCSTAWATDATHANPATVKVANRTFLDLSNTPSNVTVNETDFYSNYGPGYFISHKNDNLTNSWWSFSGTFKSTSSSYSNVSGAVGFHATDNSSSGEFYQILQMRNGSSRMTQMDFYVVGTTQIGFQWKNGGTSNKYLTFTIYEMDVTGETATDGSTPKATITGSTTSNSDQYDAATNLDGTKYYHIIVTPLGESNINLYGLTFKHAPAGTAAPTFAPTAAEVVKGQEITMSSTTSGAAIYYTTDGETTPTSASTLYDANSKPAVTAATTFKAIAIKDNTSSSVTTKAYTVRNAYAPTPDITAGTVAAGTQVELTSSDGGTIYYTTNGDEPTTESTPYEGKITINSTTTIKAKAYVNGYLGDMATLSYTVKSAPDIEYGTTAVEKYIGDANFTNALTNPNTLTVAYSISTNGTGSTINESTGEVTVGNAAGEETVTATFTENDTYAGAVVNYTLTVKAVPAISNASPASGSTVNGKSKVTLTGVGTISYQWKETGDEAPTAAGEGWTEGFVATVPNVDGDRVLYAFATDGTRTSDVSSFTYTINVLEEQTKTWYFNNWSATTMAGVRANAATESAAGKWDDHEKAGEKALNDKVYSNNGGVVTGGTMKYGETVIPETENLVFSTSNYLYGLAFDQGSVDGMGTYNGSKYLWLYGSSSSVKVTNVTAGSKIKIGIESHNTSNSRQMDVSNTDEENASVTAFAEKVFTVKADGDVTIRPNSKGMHIYYITIENNTPKEDVTVSAANYKSYNTTMPTDFSKTDGVQAFIVTAATTSSITLTEVTAVPANTPVILKTAGDYTLHGTAWAPAVTGNKLQISNGTVAGNGSTRYALANIDNVPGFYLVSDGLTIPTSYVEITGGGEARSFVPMSTEGTTTGIANLDVNANVDANTPMYNLAGQRVNKSYKGVVIVNGKKMLNK